MGDRGDVGPEAKIRFTAETGARDEEPRHAEALYSAHAAVIWAQKSFDGKNNLPMVTRAIRAKILGLEGESADPEIVHGPLPTPENAPEKSVESETIEVDKARCRSQKPVEFAQSSYRMGV